jgi:hypothetical protein
MISAKSSKQTSARSCAGLVGFALALSSGLSYAQVKTSDTPKLSAGQQSSAQPMLFSPQDKLDAIRQSLVEAALDSPTKVQSTTWIDANGSLRESSSFKNGMKVRGVKVLAYDRDEAGQAKAQLQISPASSSVSEQSRQSQGGAWQKLSSLFSLGAEQFRKNWTTNSTIAASSDDALTDTVTRCDPAINSRQLRHLINFEMQMDRDVHPAFAQAFSPIVQRSWLSPTSATKTNWKMIPGQQEPTMSDRMTAYEAALVSAPSGNAPWIARLYVRTTLLASPERGGLIETMRAGPIATLTLEVSPKEEPGLRYQESTTVAFEVDSLAWRPSRLSLASEQAIRQQVDDWGKKLVQWLSCEDVKPTVTAVNQQTISINAGAVVGVKKGDEWLIADSRNFPSQLLGKEGAPQTLLARVEAVSPYDSKLILAACPSNAVQVNWRAWPADTVVKTPSIEPASQAVQNKAVLPR